MIIPDILAILFIHWIADFVFQDVHHAETKHKSVLSMASHVGIYSAIWFIAMIPRGEIIALQFAVITFISHYAIDMITSNVTHIHVKKGVFGSRIPNFGFFTIIGFDQFLHYAQLFITYDYLILR